MICTCLLVNLLPVESVDPVSMIPESSDFNFTHEEKFYSGMRLEWTGLNDDSEDIVFKLFGPTFGYVAIGFSPTGGMQGSDIVMGWVKPSGQVFLMVCNHNPLLFTYKYTCMQ